MPSAWIARRPTKDGETRYRVIYRLGGRESAHWRPALAVGRVGPAIGNDQPCLDEPFTRHVALRGEHPGAFRDELHVLLRLHELGDFPLDPVDLALVH